MVWNGHVYSSPLTHLFRINWAFATMEILHGVCRKESRFAPNQQSHYGEYKRICTSPEKLMRSRHAAASHKHGVSHIVNLIDGASHRTFEVRGVGQGRPDVHVDAG